MFPFFDSSVLWFIWFFGPTVPWVSGSSVLRLLRFYSSLVPRFFGSSVLRFLGSSVLRFFSSSGLRFLGSSVLKFLGSSVSRFFGSSVLRLLGSSVLWFFGFSTPLFVFGSSDSQFFGSLVLRVFVSSAPRLLISLPAVIRHQFSSPPTSVSPPNIFTFGGKLIFFIIRKVCSSAGGELRNGGERKEADGGKSLWEIVGGRVREGGRERGKAE